MSLLNTVRRLLSSKPVLSGAKEDIKDSSKDILNHDIFEQNPTTGTIYQDNHDAKRLAALKQYKTVRSNLSKDQVESNINYNFYTAYGPDFTNKTAAHVSVDPPLEYRKFIAHLSDIEGLRVNTFEHYLPSKKLANDELACVIRHDVDGDLVAALQQAKIENEYGAKTTYFLLHNAPYYGLINSDGVLERNEEALEIYKEIQQLGHEIALHTDAMDLYQFHKVDGAEGITTEISWLRDNGLDLVGTTAHNSFGVYGCENFAIFEGKAKGKFANKKGVFHNGNWAPMQVLSERELGITYEANELLWQGETPVFYCALRSQNQWRVDFLNFSDAELDKHHSFGTLREYKNRFVSIEEVLELTTAIAAPAYIYVVVHPMHYGLRSSATEAPWLPTEATDLEQADIHLWAGGGPNDSIVSTAITKSNEFNTPDRGLDCYLTSKFKIAVFGETNLASKTVSADSKYSQVLSRNLARSIKKLPCSAIGVANLNSNVSQIETDYQKITDSGEPDLVVLSIQSNSKESINKLDWAKSLFQLGKQVIALIDAENTSNQSHELHKALSESYSFPIVDSNSILSQYSGGARLYWENSSIWTPHAHQLIGDALVSTFLNKYS